MPPRIPFGFIIPSHCSPEKLALAKLFRSNPTPEEARCWLWLRRRGIGGWHFRRQQVVEGFIVDFFCAKLRLVIELDGAFHDDPDAVEYDRYRDEVLVARRLKVERIRNAELTPDRLRQVIDERQHELSVEPPPPR
jgi:very-short-patch-repair endonuclease